MQQALWLYPNACPIAANQTFNGTVYRFVHGEDKVHLIFLNDRLQEVVFDTRWSSQTPKAMGKKVKCLLDAYGGANEFDVILDNAFSFTMHRRDKHLYAQYSHDCDVLSVGMMTDGEMQTPNWELRDAVP